MKEEHGGMWADYRARYGALPLDFSASISPLGLPEEVRRAAAASLSQSDRYPDPDCTALTDALSRKLQVPRRDILCGGGVSDLIYRLALALRPKRALITAPTFSEYAAALNLCGCRIVRHLLTPEEGFRVGPALLSAIQPGIDLVLLCQPNNPTGITIPKGLLSEIWDRCRACQAMLAVDESFLPLTRHAAQTTLTGLVSGSDHLLLFQSVTKTHAMAGLRLGWALSGDRALLSAMSRSGPPWGVSAPAQAAGLAALDAEDYLSRVRSLLETQRPMLQQGLEALGCQVWPGEANYLLFRTRRTDLKARLERQGILIRDCGDFPGLAPGYFRVAVRTGAENERLLSALREVLHG